MSKDFPPEKKAGLIFLLGISAVLLLVIIYLFYNAYLSEENRAFQLQVGVALLLIPLLIFFLFRSYTLLNMNYNLGRSGLSIKWGWRREDIPLNAIEWIRPAREMGFHIPKPWLVLPGSILGSRNVESLGVVDFVASTGDDLLLVATGQKVFAISPKQPRAFSSEFSLINELGSLEPLQAYSYRPRVVLRSVWQNQRSRWLIILGVVSLLLLVGITALRVNNRESITWFDGETVPGTRLFLLPILNGLLWLVDLIMGVFPYRRGTDDYLPAYALWSASILTSLLLIISILLLRI